MTSLEHELDSLRTQYTEHSEKRIADMRQLLVDLHRNRANVEALRRLRAHFHSFAGLGTTYGHPQATMLGERGERTTAQLLRDEHIPTMQHLAAWQRLVEALAADLASAAS